MVPPLPPSQGQQGSSRFFPANVGTSVTVTYQRGSSTGYTAIITVTQVISGDAAWNLLYGTNSYNDPPSQGYEYILAKIKWQYVNGPTINTSENLNYLTFTAYSSSGASYTIPLGIVKPTHAFESTVFPGATFEGWNVYQVLKTDTGPMIAFAESGGGGAWFKISS